MTATLILGGARSGKSRYAEQRAIATGKERIYVATAEAGDAEMQARIQHHQQQRTDEWLLVETPVQLAASLQQHARAGRCIVVDCLTLWLTNCLLAGDDILLNQTTALLDILPRLPGNILLVSNEVGMGIVPADPLARRFVDESGRLHQQLATLCDEVVLVVAGLPVPLKG